VPNKQCCWHLFRQVISNAQIKIEPAETVVPADGEALESRRVFDAGGWQQQDVTTVGHHRRAAQVLRVDQTLVDFEERLATMLHNFLFLFVTGVAAKSAQVSFPIYLSS
jgi:hypothetical protein